MSTDQRKSCSSSALCRSGGLVKKPRTRAVSADRAVGEPGLTVGAEALVFAGFVVVAAAGLLFESFQGRIPSALTPFSQVVSAKATVPAG